jgi:hypothetical protein
MGKNQFVVGQCKILNECLGNIDVAMMDDNIG